MSKDKKSPLSSRLFIASLKPVWDEKKVEKFIKSMTGTAQVWVMTHDQDTDEQGELIESHTHFVIEYDTPRKISTVANILDCADNFIRIGESKKGSLRYLCHLDDADKFQYDPKQVKTNTGDYNEQILAGMLSDKQIADYIRDGKGYELLGLVPANKLRTIQAFLSYDRTGQIHSQLQRVGQQLEFLSEKMLNIEQMAVGLINGATKSMESMTNGLFRIADEARLARIKAQTKR
jgi:hypothetical protein